MTSRIIATGLGKASFRKILEHGFNETKPTSLGLAVAYVSIIGFEYVQSLVYKHKIKNLRLITDTTDAITHPIALAAAQKNSWDVRVVNNLPGTFHPKLYLGGAAFDPEAGMTDISLIVAGSANLSAAALSRNGECSYLSTAPKLGASAGRTFKEFWETGKELSPALLSEYEKYFALRNRYRHPKDLITLGVADESVPTDKGTPTKTAKPPPDSRKAVPNTAATTAWAGLQSFTGDYNLQVEFPRDAGMVLARLLATVTSGNTASFLCEDGGSRDFIFRYYPDNGMFRLNVHNDTPNADWAREHKEGIAVVEADDEGEMGFRIIKPGRELLDVIDRSLALGTWGRTSTRLYGWY